MIGNEPAFIQNGAYSKGLTIREHFAAMAMQGLCASGMFTEPKLQKQCEEIGSNISIGIATAAVDIADELIAALNRPESSKNPTP